jgi:trigger factor
MKTKFEKLENSEIKLTVNLNSEEFAKYEEKGFKKIQEVIELDGFRKGNAPKDMIIAKYGEMIILEEMANLAINDTYISSIIKENENKKDEEDKLVPLSSPKVSITKIGKGSEFEYFAIFAILPKVDLVDYKKISKDEMKKVLGDEKNTSEVSEEEVIEVLNGLRKARTPHTHVHEDGTVHHHSHSASEEVSSENNPELKSEDLPALDDAFAQSFGEHFKTLEDLKNKIKDNLKLEKEAKLEDKKRTSVLGRLVSEMQITLPNVLIEDELERMKAQMKGDIERFGSKWEEYLEHLKKTEEELKKEWTEVAEKRIKSQLILSSIAKKEKVEISKEDIDKEAVKILTEMPDAPEDHVNSYVHQILLNERVMKMLTE